MKRLEFSGESLLLYRNMQTQYANLELNTEIKVIGLVKDEKHPTGFEHQMYNKSEVPVVEIEIEGKRRKVTRPKITNCVQSREGVIQNSGNRKLECVDCKEAIIYDLESNYPFEDYALPESFVCVQKIKRGKLTENGFEPIKFEKEDGSLIELYTYIINSLVWPKQ